MLDTFGHVAKESQYLRIFKFFRNFDKVLIHLIIFKIKCLKCSSKLITLMSQIASISHLSKCSVYRVLCNGFLVVVKLDMLFYYLACKLLEDCLFFFSGITLKVEF